jgi:hypothetical protein
LLCTAWLCVALQMLSIVGFMAIAATDHSTRAVYFAAFAVWKAQAAIIEVTAGGGAGGTEPTYQFSDLSGTVSRGNTDRQRL